MSIIRKYQNPSGTLPISFEDFAAKAIKDMKFSEKTSKDKLSAKQYAIDSLKKFRELYEAEGDNIYNVFKIDPLSGTYTVDVNKMKNQELKSKGTEYWTGSTGSPQTNLFGTFTTKDIKNEEGSGISKFMGVGATIFGDWLNKTKSNTEILPDKLNIAKTLGEVSLPKLQGTIKSEFGDAENYRDLFIKNKTNEELQQDIKTRASNILNKYIEESSKIKDYTYKDLESANLLKSILDNPNSTWEDFVRTSYRLKWNPEEFLHSSEESEQEKQEKQKIVDEQNIKVLSEKLSNAGFNINLTPQLLNNYSDVFTSETLPSELQYLKEPLTNSGFVVLKDKNNRNIIINPMQPEVEFKYFYQKPGSEQYGQIIGSDAKIYKPGDINYDLLAGDKFSDKILGKNSALIEGTVDGVPSKIFGIPQQENGTFNYTNRLYVETPNNETLELVHKEGDIYEDLNGKQYNINLNKFLDNKEVSPDYYSISSGISNDIFKNIPVSESARTVDEINNSIEKDENGFPIVKNTTDKNLAKVISELKNIISNSPSYSERFKAGELYNKLLMLYNNPENLKGLTAKLKNLKEPTFFEKFFNLTSSEAPISFENKYKNLSGRSFRKGGTIKFQSGGKYTTNKENLAKVKNLRGTLKDLTTLDKASLVSSAASIVPVLGVAGGLATTGIDIARDIENTGSVDIGNLAANLGFTALSLVGLGGVGAAARTARLAKSVSTAAKASKKLAISSAKKLPEYTKLKMTEQALKKIANTKGGSYKNVLNIDEFKALKEANIITEKTKYSTIINKSLPKNAKTKVGEITKKLSDIVSEVGSKPENIIKPTIEKSFGETIKINPKVLKTVSNIGKTSMALPLTISGVSAAKSAWDGGFGNVKQQDLKNLFFLTSGVRGLLKNKALAKNIKSITNTQKTKPYYEIKGKKYELKSDESPNIPKEVKSRFGRMDKGISEKANKKKFDKFKESFEKQTGEKLPEDVTFGDINAVGFEESVIGLKPIGKTALNKFDYSKAIKAIENKGTKWNFKNGGILKLQSGATVKDRKTIKDISFKDLNKISEYSTPILNTWMLAKGHKSNVDINRLVKKSLQEGLINEPLLERVNIPIPTFSKTAFEKQASEVESMGRNIASSTSDFDQALKARLAAKEQSSNLTLQGQLKDQELLNQAKREQLASDQSTSQYNLGVVGRNMQKSADIRSRIIASDANKEATDFTNWLSAVTAQNEWIKNRRAEQQVKEKGKQIADVYTSEPYREAYSEYVKYSKPDYLENLKTQAIEEAKKKGVSIENFDPTTSILYKEGVQKQEQSYKNWLNQKSLTNNIISLMTQFGLSPEESLTYSNKMINPVYKSGGSLDSKFALEDKKLSNKIILKNLEYRQKKALRETEEAIKSISRNNELLRKSLIKIFK